MYANLFRIVRSPSNRIVKYGGETCCDCSLAPAPVGRADFARRPGR